MSRKTEITLTDVNVDNETTLHRADDHSTLEWSVYDKTTNAVNPF